MAVANAGITHESWLDAQYSVLGCALLDPSAVGAVVTGTAESDYSATCQIVYQAIAKLYSSGSPTDVVAVANALGSSYHDFLKQLMEVTPSAANVGYYIQVCRSQARVLALREVGVKLSAAQRAEDVQSLMEQAEGLMVEKQCGTVATMEQLLSRFCDRGKESKSYLPWPIRELQDRLYTEPGDLVILGGYPSAGKSAFALQCSMLWAKDRRVGIYSLETSPDKLFDRMMASVMDVELSDIKKNRIPDGKWLTMPQIYSRLKGLQLEIIPASGMSPADIKATAIARRHQIVVIDYLQLLQAPGSSRYEQVTNISLSLHTMAQSMGITVVALSQLKRSANSGDVPTMADLRESGQIEQDADLILMLALADPKERDGDRNLYVAKNKEGTCPAIRLAFDGPHQTFRKTSQSSKVIGKYAADGKKARAKNRQMQEDTEQFSILPGNDPLPF